MIYAIITFSPRLDSDMIKEICTKFNIKASIINPLTHEWCLETEDGANLFNLGMKIKALIESN